MTIIGGAYGRRISDASLGGPQSRRAALAEGAGQLRDVGDAGEAVRRVGATLSRAGAGGHAAQAAPTKTATIRARSADRRRRSPSDAGDGGEAVRRVWGGVVARRRGREGYSKLPVSMDRSEIFENPSLLMSARRVRDAFHVVNDRARLV
jgi:hypothetical protein